jgi:hypothetical protein
MNENAGNACIIYCLSDDQLERPRHRPADNMKVFLTVIHLAQDKD